MPNAIFDMRLRAMRRDRAFRRGGDPFLLQRALDDCLERLALEPTRFRNALMIGCADAQWPARLGQFAAEVSVLEPGRLHAQAVDGEQIVEDEWLPPSPTFDLCLAVGTLDTVNDLPRALRSIGTSLVDGALFIGALSGGETLPRLRAAMHSADRQTGASTPHVHPRIEAAALAPLLETCGFTRPVVDVDRVSVRYRSFDRLVDDLRTMAGTNILKARERSSLTRAARDAAAAAFLEGGDGESAVELFEILHFAAWTGATAPAGGHG